MPAGRCWSADRAPRGRVAIAVEALWSTVEWTDEGLLVLDQTLLPARTRMRRLHTLHEVVEAIRGLVVRGAPAIGVCGAFGLVVALDEARPATTVEARGVVAGAASSLVAARPTAVNLGYAVRRTEAAAVGGETPEEMRRLALEEALRIREEDRRSCLHIGAFGRAELARVRSILTHCNTGRLATTGIGTALAVVYAKAESGEPVEVLVSETRPLLQGARLTAWELADAGIPVTLLTEASAGAAMAAGRVEAVLVGCDRVARNGDTANKIGTYGHAVLARAHGIPFYVCGPMSSFDPAVATGADIEIEMRDPDEVRSVAGTAVAPDVEAWNPAFDLTPARLVTAFITDVGVLRPPFEPAIAAALQEAGRQGLRRDA